MKKNIVLIGMPGVGKSTIGVILAKVAGYQFLDSDLLIQQEQGKLLSEIIKEKGTDGFIQIENDVNSRIQVEHSVIATGGSAVYGEEAMAHLTEIGTVVYLKQDLKSIQRRLHNIKGRGVVLKEGQTFEQLYEERCVLYEKYAEVTVDEHGLSIEKTLSLLIKKLTEAGAIE